MSEKFRHLVVPPQVRQFNQQLRTFDWDLEAWRSYQGKKYDFMLLDRNKQAGWDLAKSLLRKRDKFNRGRLSVNQALRHRFFLPELF